MDTEGSGQSEQRVVPTSEAVDKAQKPVGAEVEDIREHRKLVLGQERRVVKDLDEEVLVDLRGRCSDIIPHLQERLSRAQSKEEIAQIQQDIDILTAVSSLSPKERSPNAILLTCAAGRRLEEILETEQEELWRLTSGTEFTREGRAKVLEAAAKADQLKTFADLAEEEAEKDPFLRQRAEDLRNQAEQARKGVEEKARELRILEIEQATDRAVRAAGETRRLEEEALRAERELKQASQKEEKTKEKLSQAERELDRLFPPGFRELEQKRRTLEEEVKQAEDAAKKAETEAKEKTDYLQSWEYQKKLSEAQEKIDDAKRKEDLKKQEFEQIRLETKKLEDELKVLKKKSRLGGDEFQRKLELQRETSSEKRTGRINNSRREWNEAENERKAAEKGKAKIEEEAKRVKEETERKAKEVRDLAENKKKEAKAAKKKEEKAIEKLPDFQVDRIKRKLTEKGRKAQALEQARKEKGEKGEAKQKAEELLSEAKPEYIEAQSLVKQLQAAERRRKLMEDDIKVLREEIESLKKTLWESRSRFQEILAYHFGEEDPHQWKAEKAILRWLRVLPKEIVEERRRATQIMIEDILANPSAFLARELDLKAERKEIVAETPREAAAEEETPTAEEVLGQARKKIESLSPEQKQELENDLKGPKTLEGAEEIKRKWAERLGLGLGVIGLIFALIGELAKLEKRGG